MKTSKWQNKVKKVEYRLNVTDLKDFYGFFLANEKVFSSYKNVLLEAKGHLFSNGLFGVIVSTKKPTTFFQGFLP